MKGLSYFLYFDDTEELNYDLQEDELIKRELSFISGQLVLRGGRLVAIGSAIFHVIKHIDFSSDKQSHERSPGQSHEQSHDSGVDEFL